MHVSVSVHVCKLVDIPVCVHESVHSCLLMAVCTYGVYVHVGARDLTFGVGDSLSFYFLRQGLIINPELASSASLASQLAPGNQSPPTGITALPLGKPSF